jgi:hypothetical protein
MLGLLVAAQGPSWLQVGRVTAVYWEGDATKAAALAELADRMWPWPGIREPVEHPIRLVVVSDAERFDSLTAGRLPEWGVAAAFPATNTIVLRPMGDPRRALRHELAHLALHSVVRSVPRWFDEGYAVWAAGEWGRLEALRVNWALLRGERPSLIELDGYLRGPTASSAEAAYALAATAVLFLERLGGERGLEPILLALATDGDIDRALRRSYQVTLGQFEDLWRRDLKNRYGWLLVLSTFSAFWAVAGVMLVALWVWRRHRDQERRAALDEGWVVHDDPWDTPA